MVNPDSDLYRAHPDWVLAPGDRAARRPRATSRCSTSAHPEAYAYVLGRIDALLREYPIAYVKWDHNRDLATPARSTTGARPRTARPLALYRLLDELRAAHPGLEIESCASGGGRVDLGMLERTDRVWDERQQRRARAADDPALDAVLLAAGADGRARRSDRAHTTGRTHDLSFRAATALFGHAASSGT